MRENNRKKDGKGKNYKALYRQVFKGSKFRKDNPHCNVENVNVKREVFPKNLVVKTMVFSFQRCEKRRKNAPENTVDKYISMTMILLSGICRKKKRMPAARSAVFWGNEKILLYRCLAAK